MPGSDRNNVHLHTRVNQLAVKFVILQVETGLTFCRLAAGAPSELIGRLKVNAKRSYENAIYHVSSVVLNADERLIFQQKKQKLRECLMEFGFVA